MKFLKKVTGFLKPPKFLGAKNQTRVYRIGWNKNGVGKYIVDETAKKDFVNWSAIQITKKVGVKSDLKIPGYWKVTKEFFDKVPKALLEMYTRRIKDYLNQAQSDMRKKGYSSFIIFNHELACLEFEEIDSDTFKVRATVKIWVNP